MGLKYQFFFIFQKASPKVVDTVLISESVKLKSPVAITVAGTTQDSSVCEIRTLVTGTSRPSIITGFPEFSATSVR